MLIKDAIKNHCGEPLYEVAIHNSDNMDRQSSCYETMYEVYLTMEEALEVARKLAGESAWFAQANDMPNFTQFVCIFYGRKYSKKTKGIYGFPKIIYVISSNTKEKTDEAVKDPRWKRYPVNEYTIPPVINEEDFYEWPDEE